ncbi:MAG: methyltransferase domain-containing protein [Verrucomicrobia bacterium]|jgi:SAM-dependent methyltransferase|nr:MAG: methyltransferase domain-containing protein [Verrucomicrobiota bacterium]
MNTSTGTDWDSLYQKNEMQWDKGEASPGLVDFLRDEPLQGGERVLVPGCGRGHDARAWAKAGFVALGLDISPTAVLRAQELAIVGSSVKFCEGDFLQANQYQGYDWLFEHTLFCAIQPELRRDYVKAAARSVRQGGHFLAVHYLIPDVDGPPFGTTRDEVCERFESDFHLIKDWVPRSYPNRTGLERMFYWKKR